MPPSVADDTHGEDFAIEEVQRALRLVLCRRGYVPVGRENG